MSGGSTRSERNLPKFFEQDMQQGLDFGQNVAATGFVPYYGPDVAALAPQTQAAFDTTNLMANAFNMPSADISSYLPQSQTFADGTKGYSSAPLFEQSMDTLAQKRPGQASYIDSFFIDPVTGEPGSNVASVQPVDYQMTAKRGK